MHIQLVELQTANLNATANFYRKVMGMELVENANDHFAIQNGRTKTRFIESGGQPFYHIAWNIPENKMDEAEPWLASRVPLLTHQGKTRMRFESNAHAIYFYDPSGNIMEFIARHDLANATDEPFGIDQLLEVSEVGMPVPDVEAYVPKISQGTGHGIWEKSSLNDTLTFVGQEDGMLIIVRQNRDWLMTADPAFPWPVRVEMSGPADAHFQDNDFGYEVQVNSV